ncbi:MAG: hypothetical protein IGS38_12260 [Synechococcales cyanobacterium M58_A2018_015]|nr:hypothetical protein [Synechococcales cyanobacterium M58_A2018_015]
MPMIQITSQEIARYRSELSDNPSALQALDMIEDCEGDLEDAAIALGLHVGQEPDRSDQWLDGLAKRWRVSLCQAEIQAALKAGSIASAVALLTSETSIPDVLATPVVLYAIKSGIEDFCKPLQEKLQSDLP